MSFQRDYILRIIEEIAKFIAILLNLKQEKKFNVAYDVFTKKSNKVVGCAYDEFLKMTFDEFKSSLQNKTITSDYLDTLGRYFMVSGELCLGMEKDDEAIHNLNFAKACFVEAEQKFSTYSFNRQVDLEKLQNLFIRVGMV